MISFKRVPLPKTVYRNGHRFYKELGDYKVWQHLRHTSGKTYVWPGIVGDHLIWAEKRYDRIGYWN